MPDPAATLIDGVIREGLVGPAKVAGFKKSSRTWSRSPDTLTWQIANVQGSQANHAGHARFTLNLGVYFPGVAKVLEREPDRFPPHLHYCQIGVRIGQLMSGSDHWWTIGSESEIGAVATDLRLRWEQQALPWLEEVADPKRALDWLESRGFPFSSPVKGIAMALSIGDRERALRIVSANRTSMKPAAIDWVEARGLA